MSVADTDFLLPFQIDAGAFRGRLIRLGPAVDAILSGHSYPGAVAELLAETLALAAALAGALKYEGIFSLQTQGDGPVSLLVADVTSAGDLRGYARFDADKLKAAEGGDFRRLLGGGYLAFTVDQGGDTDRYQGIVELDGATLADCVRRYFSQSEQLETELKVAVGHDPDAGWRASALMLQRMPVGGPNQPIFIADEADELWRRAVILTASLTPGEMLDPALSSERLLYRLYHDDALRTHETRSLQARCRCSDARVAQTLKSFPRPEIEDMRDDDGTVVVTCEFCKSRYVFDDRRLDELYS